MATLYESTLIAVCVNKYATGSPTLEWANKYYLKLDVPLASMIAWQSIASAFVTFEQDLHMANVGFKSVVLSTYEPETGPSRHEAFLSYDTTGVLGQRPAGGGEPLDVRIVWRTNWNTILGRNGIKYYRGALSEPDIVSTTSLDMRFTSTFISSMSLVLYNSYDTLIDTLDVLSGGSSVVLLSKNNDLNPENPQPAPGAGPVVRPVIGVSVGQPTVRSINHRYYDVP